MTLSIYQTNSVTTPTQTTTQTQGKKVAGGKFFLELQQSQATNSAALSGGTSISAPTSLASFTSNYDEWFSEWSDRNKGYDSVDKKAAARDDFLAIADKAITSNAYADPQKFVASLSGRELAVLRQIHGLADPINPATLSQEGALNLLLPPNQSQDIDGNGFVSVGVGQKFLFPPVDADPKIKAAWNLTKSSVKDYGTILTMELSLAGRMSPNAPANNIGKNNSPNGTLDYTKMVSDIIEGLEYSRQYNPSPIQQKSLNETISGFQLFLNNLRNV